MTSSVPATSRNAPIAVTAALLVLGAVLIVVGVIYLSRSAGQLPAFFPGHKAGSAHHHTTHAIAAFIVAALAFIGAWFSTGQRKAGQAPSA